LRSAFKIVFQFEGDTYILWHITYFARWTASVRAQKHKAVDALP
jgi:hypothetical protein